MMKDKAEEIERLLFFSGVGGSCLPLHWLLQHFFNFNTFNAFCRLRMRGIYDFVYGADYYNPGSLSGRRCRIGDELLKALECCKP